MLEDLQASVARLPEPHFWFFAGLGALLVAAVAYAFVRSVVRARIIMNTPTSKVRSAAQGYVELGGRAELIDGPPIIAPLTSTPCCWYRYEVRYQDTTYHGGRRRTRWRSVADGTSDELFQLRDDTGRCVIDPEGAEVTARHRDRWRGSTEWPVTGPRAAAGLLGGGDYAYTEYRIHPGDPLYAIGYFRTLDDVAAGSLREEVGAIIRAWKRDPERHLAHFDRNADGEVDLQEWQAVRAAALTEAESARRERRAAGPVHTLVQGDDPRRPYMLSAYPQQRLVRRYRLQAALALAGFLAASGALGWLLLARPGA